MDARPLTPTQHAIRRLQPYLFRLTPRTRWFRVRSMILVGAGYDVALDAECVSTVQFHSPGVSLGSASFCAHHVAFFGGPRSRIEIGASVEVGPQTTFVARTHHLGPPTHRAGASKETEIIVEAGTWIGARAVIIGPCHIGAGCVIGAGAVVHGEIPANTMVPGTHSTWRRLD